MSLEIDDYNTQLVDALRYDKIRNQRIRIEHIYEMLKDNTFKRNQAQKQNDLLKKQIQQYKKYKHLYEQIQYEHSQMIEKNMIMNKQIHQYQQSILKHQILIQELKQELSLQSKLNVFQNNKNNDQYMFTVKNNLDHLSQAALVEQLQILKRNYDDLELQYNNLYKKYYQILNLNDQKRHSIQRRQSLKYRANRLYNKTFSPNMMQNVSRQKSNQFLKLKQKYQKCKVSKKQLNRQNSILLQELNQQKNKQKQLLQLVEILEILKSKKSKICMCHFQKLQKQVSQVINQQNITKCVK